MLANMLSKSCTIQRINKNLVKADEYFWKERYRMAHIICILISDDIRQLWKRNDDGKKALRNSKRDIKLKESFKKRLDIIKEKIIIKLINSEISKIKSLIMSKEKEKEKNLIKKYYEWVILDLERLSKSGFNIRIFKKDILKLLSIINRNSKNDELENKSDELERWTKQKCPKLFLVPKVRNEVQLKEKKI